MFAALLLALAQDPPPRFVEALGHPGALVITGADTVGEDAVERALLSDPDWFEASLPMQRLSSYVAWLEGAVTIAYRNAGFVEVQVTSRVDDDAGQIELDVVEGPRHVAAELAVEGAVRLDEERIRAVLRAGALERAATNPARPAEPPPPPFWVPGEPAPASAVDRERFEQLVEAAVFAAGFHDAETRLRWELGNDDTVRPTLTVTSEGQRSTVQDVRFEGAPTESADDLRRWAALPDGAPATVEVRRAVEGRLRATGRFLDVRTRYEGVPDQSGQVVLAVRVAPNPIAPPATEHPGEDLALLVAGVDRLSRLSLDADAGAVGMKLEVDVQPAALAALRGKLADLGLDPGDGGLASYRVDASVVQRAASFELSRAVGDDAPAPLMRLWLDADGGRIECPPLGVAREFGSTSAEVLAILQGAVKPVIDDPERPVNLNFSGGIQTSRREDGAPVRVVFDVHPSLPLYLLSRWSVDPASDEETLRLTFDSETARARLDARRDGTRLVAEVDADADGVTGAFTLGDLDAPEPPPWSRAEPAPVEAGAARGQRAALTLLRTVLAASELEERHAAVALLGVTGLQALVNSDSRSSEQEPGTAREFRVPRRPPAARPTEAMRRISEQFATMALEGRAPGSWCGHLLRCLPLLAMPTSNEELSASGVLLGQIAGDPARGPLGAWLAAECCASLGRPQWARPMAQVGREDLSAARFVADCETLLGSPGDEARGAGARRVAAAWRDLYRRALDDDDPLLDATERATVRAIFGDASADDERAMWEAGLVALWDELLKDAVAKRLEALATG